MKSNKTLVGISYGRVSTDGQFKDASGNVKDDASPAMQRKRCQEFVEGLSLQKNSSYKIIEHLEDNGYSGKNTDRPQFQRLVRLIKSKKIQFVIVTELSRLSRSNADFHEFIKLCKDSSVELHILNIQGLDLNSPMSSVILSLMAALAQMERELTSQRVKAGARQRLKSEGKINGAKELLGLDPDLSPNRLGHFIANPGELDSVEKILEVFLKSASKDETLNEVSRRAIKGKHGKELTEANLNTILKNCAWKYRGLWELNRKNKDQDQDDLPYEERYEVVVLPHGPLIPIDLLDRVLKKTHETYQKKHRSGKEGFVYILSQLLVTDAGKKLTGQQAKGNLYRYYAGGGLRISCEDLEKKIVSHIKKIVRSNEHIGDIVSRAHQSSQDQLNQIADVISKKNVQLEKVLDKIQKLAVTLGDSIGSGDGVSEVLKAASQNTYEEKKTLEMQLADLGTQRDTLTAQVQLKLEDRDIRAFLNRFDDLTRVEQRSFLETVLKRVTVTRDNKLKLEFRLKGEDPHPAYPRRGRSARLEESLHFSRLDGGSCRPT